GHTGGGGGGGGHTPPPPLPPPGKIHHSPESEKHILQGDGGKQGGHLAGTGIPNKTEFPKSWTPKKIMDESLDVAKNGTVTHGPKPTKDAHGNMRMSWEKEGTRDGVTIRVIVLDDGEIRTAFPVAGKDLIFNPPSPQRPNVASPSSSPRYSNPALGGNGDWTFIGKKKDSIIKVVTDGQGHVLSQDSWSVSTASKTGISTFKGVDKATGDPWKVVVDKDGNVLSREGQVPPDAVWLS
ncbi:EndoU domain-containing protein, partial [Kitasatospora sp. LaBMicrA B282]|uniref:EndoU domain-containing protein n=1 Tax=Kitasatospora sp. LaBMicrA B282 TaxID=3420949 RepID=UPI003D14C7E2